MNVVEIDPENGEVIAGGLQGSVVLNADATNPVPADPDLNSFFETHDPIVVSGALSSFANPNFFNPNFFNPNFFNLNFFNPNFFNPNFFNPNFFNPNFFNPNFFNPNFFNPNFFNPNFFNPNFFNPNFFNPNFFNPNFFNPNFFNPNFFNPNFFNPNFFNPNFFNPNFFNTTLTELEWEVQNSGNAASTYSFSALNASIPEDAVAVQLVVTKLSVDPAENFDSLGNLDCALGQLTTEEIVLDIFNRIS